jgi:hypothetical protein
MKDYRELMQISSVTLQNSKARASVSLNHDGEQARQNSPEISDPLQSKELLSEHNTAGKPTSSFGVGSLENISPINSNDGFHKFFKSCGTKYAVLQDKAGPKPNARETQKQVLKKVEEFRFFQLKSPKVVSPKVVSPKVVSPKVVSPKVVSPKVVSPKVVSPKVVSPKTNQFTLPKNTDTPTALKEKICLDAFRKKQKSFTAAFELRNTNPIPVCSPHVFSGDLFGFGVKEREMRRSSEFGSGFFARPKMHIKIETSPGKLQKPKSIR